MSRPTGGLAIADVGTLEPDWIYGGRRLARLCHWEAAFACAERAIAFHSRPNDLAAERAALDYLQRAADHVRLMRTITAGSE